MDWTELFIESMPFAVWKTNEYGIIDMVNTEFCKLFKIEKTNIINKEEKIMKEFLKEKSMENLNIQKYCIDKINVIEYIVEDKIVEVYRREIKRDGVKSTLGVAIDITRRVVWEREVLRQKNMLNSIINAIPDSIFFKDKNSKFLGCNKVFEKIIGKKVEDIIGKGEEGLFYSKEEIEAFYKKDREVMESGKIDITETKFNKNNRVTILEDIKAPIWDESGEVMGVVGISRDITHRKLLEDKLTILSYKDKLTGLYNRTFLDKIKVENSFNKLSIIMGDLNGLKIVNDLLGHFEGDKFLISIANIINDVILNKGVAIRWGGDEIIIILPNTSGEDALHIADEINLRCKEKKNRPVPLSISLGVASLQKNNQSLDDLIKEAEDKVYKKKLFSNLTIKGEILKSIKENLDCKKYIDIEENKRKIMITRELARQLNLSNEKIRDTMLVMEFQNIGMIGIPDEIILKKENRKEEIELLNTHSEKGYRIAMLDNKIAHISVGILTHHERWDGNGYPLGLKEKEIPIESRIVHLINYYENLRKEYINKGLESDILEKLKNESGKMFDPYIVKEFIKLLNKGLIM